jgi:Protein of unknown function (DUF4230)
MTSGSAPPPRSRRRLVAAAVAGLALVAAAALVAQRVRRGVRAEEMVIVEGIRKVCKLATIEMSLADYARRTVPKTIDLPFTHEPEAYLFYSGVVSAGFDVCDEPVRVDVDHATHVVRVALPPPRILSLDIKRFETINEHSGFLNAIAPADRNGWYQEAREALTKAALAQGVLPRAETHARELFGDFVSRWGYQLTLTVGDAAPPAAPDVARDRGLFHR